jgi:hypothetical protein
MEKKMKYKIVAFLLALTMMSWAQSAGTNQSSTSEQKPAAADAKTGCACCEKVASAEHKDGMARMRHKSGAKDKAGCCSGKDSSCKGKEGKACMNDAKMADCCKEGKSSDGKETNCCSGKEGADKANCCDGVQCGKEEHAHQAS